MSDKSIRDAIHGLQGSYEDLGALLACYEAWGGRAGEDADCDGFLGEQTGEE